VVETVGFVVAPILRRVPINPQPVPFGRICIEPLVTVVWMVESKMWILSDTMPAPMIMMASNVTIITFNLFFIPTPI